MNKWILYKLNQKGEITDKENTDEVAKIYNEILKQKEDCKRQIIRRKDYEQKIIINKSLVKRMKAHRKAMNTTY